jgi:hypothetical protein
LHFTLLRPIRFHIPIGKHIDGRLLELPPELQLFHDRISLHLITAHIQQIRESDHKQTDNDQPISIFHSKKKKYIAQAIITSLPMSVRGKTSPYPTVVIVDIAAQQAIRKLPLISSEILPMGPSASMNSHPKLPTPKLKKIQTTLN